MKTLFETIADDINPSDCSLVCELTSDEFSYAVKNNQNHHISSLGVYQYEASRPKSGFQIALQILFHQHTVLSKRFSKTCFIHSVPSSVLVPFTMYNSQKNEDVISLVHGDMVTQNATILTDKISFLDLYNIYALPSEVQQTVFHLFPAVTPVHQYSVLLQDAPETDKMKVIFYHKKMVVALWKNGVCQLINTFQFKSTEDVSYIFLNLARQFETPDIPVEISGFIEESSLLYKSIFKYFSDVSFSSPRADYQLPEYLSQFPSHFFHHMYAFDLCE